MAYDDQTLTPDRKDWPAFVAKLNPLPRSVVRPGEYELLDGEWRFALDLDDHGLGERWYEGYAFAQTARWPGSIESQIAGAADAKRERVLWEDKVVAWYEREFTIPEAWLAAPEALVQLTFGACGYETRVWLNGSPLNTIEGEAVHYGEYTSFTYELPPELLRPVNRVTVRIADSLDADIPRGKQQSRVYKQGGIWYQTISGGVRSVWIEPVRRNRLRTRVSIVSSIEDGLVEIGLTTRVHDPGDYRVRIVVTRKDAEAPVSVEEFALPLEAGSQQRWFVTQIREPALWSPESPRLYQMAAQLITPRGGVSQVEASFGLRKIEARGRFVYLNNEPVYLDGILYQPASATFDEIRAHMHAMKRLGCNLVRVHIAGVDPRVYELADELGLLLWVEVPSPHSSTALSRQNHWAEMMRMLQHIGQHPSIVIWSLYNEDWGAEDIAESAETRAYIAEAYDYLRLKYPHLLVVDNDGWQHVSVEGRLKSRLLTAHLYTPDLARWRELLDMLVAGQTVGVAFKPLTAGDPFFYRGQVPLVVSEWGGFGFADYGGPENLDTRGERIAEFKRELRARPIAGDIYTQATSIEDEDNGVIDPKTGELLVPEGLLGPVRNS
jgi:beta-galactosidase/beta-glucuronidase